MRDPTDALFQLAPSCECDRVLWPSAWWKKRRTRRQSQRRDLSRRMLAHASRQFPAWLIFDVRRDLIVEPELPLKQTSTAAGAELDCSVRRMKIESTSESSVRTSARAARRASRCQQRSVGTQRRALVRRVKPRGVQHATPPSLVRSDRRRFSVVATVRLRTPSEPNKAPEPTTTAVMPRAIADSILPARLAGARVTPAVVVAHL
jgi:hypothetical protein